MPDRALAERVALGMVSAWRARVAHLDGHDVSDHDGVVVAWSGLAPTELSVALVEREPTDPIAALTDAERAFERHGGTLGVDLERGRHPVVDDAVRRLGLSCVVTRPAMLVDVGSVAPPVAPDDVELDRVTDDGVLAEMAPIETDAFGTAPDVVAEWFGQGLLELPQVRAYVARSSGDPVGMAFIYEHERSLGVFGVGVLEGARRRGIGRAITAFAIREAASASDADVAWLQPSELGRPVYDRMGFEVVSTWDVWSRRG